MISHDLSCSKCGASSGHIVKSSSNKSATSYRCLTCGHVWYPGDNWETRKIPAPPEDFDRRFIFDDILGRWMDEQLQEYKK